MMTCRQFSRGTHEQAQRGSLHFRLTESSTRSRHRLAACLPPGVFIDDQPRSGLHKCAEAVQQTESPVQEHPPQCNRPIDLWAAKVDY
jgi:hypothetical protein